MRLMRHLLMNPWRLRRVFPPVTLAAVQRAVEGCERRHAGEIRIVVEGALSPAAVLRGQSPRARARQLFAELGVWDTEYNNGVLVYVLLADRDVEIVADRGVGNARVPVQEWEACCRIIEDEFRAGRFERGLIAGIEACADVLSRYPPAHADHGNELPDQPLLL